MRPPGKPAVHADPADDHLSAEKALKRRRIDHLPVRDESLEPIGKGERAARKGAVADLQEPVSRANVAFAEATARLDAEDSADFVGELRSKYRDLARRVRDAAGALETADTALRVMPEMLGRSGERNFLLVFQNNAEGPTVIRVKIAGFYELIPAGQPGNEAAIKENVPAAQARANAPALLKAKP